MKKSNAILLVAFITLALFFLAFQFTFHRYVKKGEASGIGAYVSQKKPLSTFNKLKIRGEAMVLFRNGKEPYVHIQGPQYLLDSLKIHIANEELTISTGNVRKGKDSIVLNIQNNGLESLDLNSEGYFETKDTLSGKTLRLWIRDQSTAKLCLAYDSIFCRTAPKAKVSFKGISKKIDFSNIK